MSARPHAPSQQRIAEARASGHVPRAPLLRLVGLLGLLAVGVSQAEAFGRELVALFEARTPADALTLLRALTLRTAWSLALILALVALGSWLGQGPTFVHGRAKRFAPAGVDRTASILFASGGLALLVYFLHDTQRFDVALADYGWSLALLTLVCLAIDLALARARWFQSLWMTRRELLDEQREQGVSPEVAAARRRARQV